MSAAGMQIAQLTDVGRVREHNEDGVLALALDSTENRPGISAVLLVADGVGGHEAGEVASALAVETVRETFAVPRHLDAFSDPRDLLDAVIREANARVYALGTTHPGRPGTTMTLAALSLRHFTVGHVGDSRAYLVSLRSARQVTEDDSHVAEAVRRGQMTPEEARVSPFRNQLSKCIGTQSEVQPSFFEGAWEEGDVILLCSDGLSEYVEEAEIAEVVRRDPRLEDACQWLVDPANARGGDDNISVVLARNGGTIVTRKPATAPNLAVPQFTEPPPPPSNAKTPQANRRLRTFLKIVSIAAVILLGFYASTRFPLRTASVSGGKGALGGMPGQATPRPGQEPPAASENVSMQPSVRVQLDPDEDGLRVMASGFQPIFSPGFNEVEEREGFVKIKFNKPENTRRSMKRGATFVIHGPGGAIQKVDDEDSSLIVRQGSKYFIQFGQRKIVAEFTVQPLERKP